MYLVISKAVFKVKKRNVKVIKKILKNSKALARLKSLLRLPKTKI